MGCLEAEKLFLATAELQTPFPERSGSCAIIALIVEKECYVANLGDSRAFMSVNHGKRLF